MGCGITQVFFIEAGPRPGDISERGSLMLIFFNLFLSFIDWGASIEP